MNREALQDTGSHPFVRMTELTRFVLRELYRVPPVVREPLEHSSGGWG